MKLIYPLGNAVILDEGGRNRIAWEVDRRSIRCYQFIAANKSPSVQVELKLSKTERNTLGGI